MSTSLLLRCRELPPSSSTVNLSSATNIAPSVSVSVRDVMLSPVYTTPNLDGGQTYSLEAFRRGKSVALIGGAGSGKSFLLNLLIREAEETHGGYPSVVPCAFSNKAAEAMNGVTIHRLFAAKPSWEFSREYLLEGVKQRPQLCKMLKGIRVLIIDEISLLTSNIMDSIDFVLRELSASEWHSSLPFGGRQLVVAGDPFQLEPHPDVGCIQTEALQASYDSRSWYLSFGPLGDGVIVILKGNHRQRDDKNFYEILSRIRIGKHSQSDISFLNDLGGRNSTPPESLTRLCLTNLQTAEINQRNLNLLTGSAIRSVAFDTYYDGNKMFLEPKLTKVAPAEVVLKVAARVILTRKMGDVMPGSHAIVRRVINLTASSHNKAIPIEVELETYGTSNVNEVGGNRSLSGKFLRVRSTRYDIHSYDRTVIASREQLPLIPAYAITIHRSQGMTLSHVAVNFDMANSWKPNGMVYVALSRCKTSSGLWVRCLRDEFISVSVKAKAFMKELRDLHVHIPSRIWGVEDITSLCLTDDDIGERPRTLAYVPALPRLGNERSIDGNQNPTLDADELRSVRMSFDESSSSRVKRFSKPISPISKGRFVFQAVSPNVPNRGQVNYTSSTLCKNMK